MRKIARGIDKFRLDIGHSAFYLSIERRKRYFRTAEERDDAYERAITLRKLGYDNAAVTVREEVALTEMKKLAAGRSETLLEIFKAGLASMPDRSALLEDAIKRFFDEKDAAVKANAMKKRSFNQQRSVVNLLQRETGIKFVREIKNPEFESWLRGRGMSPKGLHSFGKALGVFLNWCVKKKYLIESPLSEINIPEPPPKRSIFTTMELKALLDLAARNFPALVPLLSLQWFAGIRPETAERLDYGDIDRDQRLIRLRVGKFAQGDVQFVERIPDALWHWLPNRKAGPVAPPNCKHLVSRLHQQAGYGGGKWPQDVARHTFVSHFASLNGSLEAVAYAINHKQSSTTLRYYRRRVSLAEAKAYFALRPNPKLSRILRTMNTANAA